MNEPTTNTQSPKKKKWIGYIIGVLAFAIGFVVIKEAKEWYLTLESHQKLEQPMDDFRAKAVAGHSDKPISVAVQEVATKQSIQSLKKKSGNDKADVAAGQFVGFYFVNVKARALYCKGHGVDISAFTNSFAKDHAELYSISRKIHNRGPMSADRVESETLAQILPTMERTIKESTEDYAKRNNMSVIEVCEALQENAVEAAKQMRLQTLNPTLYNALLQYK